MFNHVIIDHTNAADESRLHHISEAMAQRGINTLSDEDLDFLVEHARQLQLARDQSHQYFIMKEYYQQKRNRHELSESNPF